MEFVPNETQICNTQEAEKDMQGKTMNETRRERQREATLKNENRRRPCKNEEKKSNFGFFAQFSTAS
ncbi:hypothetical protein BDW42DRAFT_173880 [Aspergillus taichungensis]|uniref:Uncharacterized protein n=1 Tax=Aspergillus taichungensis TaxID=482145 RepID=A0A2J5HP38_9EURO|nr:hypothetical protein BDW42DRAFT_173880 [Aspergillus taichungensis]